MTSQQTEGVLMDVLQIKGFCHSLSVTLPLMFGPCMLWTVWTQHSASRSWSPPADNSANGLVASHNTTCRAKDNIQIAAVVK